MIDLEYGERNDMSTLRKLQTYLFKMQDKNFQEPKSIPVSRIEVMDIINEAHGNYIPVAPSPQNKIFGLDAEICDYSESLRTKRLEIPLSQYMVEYNIDEAIYNNTVAIQDSLLQGLRATLKSTLLTDKTRLEIEFEWDIFARAKRFFHITKWFPVKTRKAFIDCNILYPYCKVQFPHNKHTRQFKFQEDKYGNSNTKTSRP